MRFYSAYTPLAYRFLLGRWLLGFSNILLNLDALLGNPAHVFLNAYVTLQGFECIEMFAEGHLVINLVNAAVAWAANMDAFL